MAASRKVDAGFASRRWFAIVKARGPRNYGDIMLNAMRKRGGAWSALLAGLAATQLLWACVGTIGDGAPGEGEGEGEGEQAAQQIGETTRQARRSLEPPPIGPPPEAEACNLVPHAGASANPTLEAIT